MKIIILDAQAGC